MVSMGKLKQIFVFPLDFISSVLDESGVTFREIITRKGLRKISRSVRGWRNLFALERRRGFRYGTSMEIEFYVWDEVAGKPLTAKVAGRLVNISGKGACLQTPTIRIGYHHLGISGGLEGVTSLRLEIPSPSEGNPWTLKSRILWFNKIAGEGRFKFAFGIEFVEISLAQQKLLASLIKSI
jgi:hypothetical protein